jgi:hypothetical protein
VETPEPPGMQTASERDHLYDLIVGRWCLGIDTLDWKLYRSAFADAVHVEFPDPLSPVIVKSKHWRTDDWIDIVRRVEGFDSTQHFLSNFRFQVDGDAAEVSSYLLAEHHLDGDHFTLGGQSSHSLKRGADGWQVVKVALRPWWTKGDQALLARAVERYASGRAPRSATAVG